MQPALSSSIHSFLWDVNGLGGGAGAAATIDLTFYHNKGEMITSPSRSGCASTSTWQASWRLTVAASYRQQVDCWEQRSLLHRSAEWPPAVGALTFPDEATTAGASLQLLSPQKKTSGSCLCIIRAFVFHQLWDSEALHGFSSYNGRN